MSWTGYAQQCEPRLKPGAKRLLKKAARKQRRRAWKTRGEDALKQRCYTGYV